MMKKHLKINETAVTAFILLFLGGFVFNANYNNKQQAIVAEQEATKKTELIDFVSKVDDAEKQRVITTLIAETEKTILDGNFDKAIADLTEAIKTYPQIGAVYMLRAYAYYQNNQSELALKDTDMVFPLIKENSSSLLFTLRGDIFRDLEEFDLALDAYEKAYELLPSDRGVVHDYTGGLIFNEQYEKAYGVMKKYFIRTPKEEYWNDVDVWLDLGIASLKTHRCLEAGASGWHVLMRTKEGEDNNKMAEGIMHEALNDTDCINNETFPEDDTPSASDPVAA